MRTCSWIDPLVPMRMIAANAHLHELVDDDAHRWRTHPAGRADDRSAARQGGGEGVEATVARQHTHAVEVLAGDALRPGRVAAQQGDRRAVVEVTRSEPEVIQRARSHPREVVTRDRGIRNLAQAAAWTRDRRQRRRSQSSGSGPGDSLDAHADAVGVLGAAEGDVRDDRDAAELVVPLGHRCGHDGPSIRAGDDGRGDEAIRLRVTVDRHVDRVAGAGVEPVARRVR